MQPSSTVGQTRKNGFLNCRVHAINLYSEMQRADAVAAMLRLCTQWEYLCAPRNTVEMEVLALCVLYGEPCESFPFWAELPNWASSNFAGISMLGAEQLAAPRQLLYTVLIYLFSILSEIKGSFLQACVDILNPLHPYLRGSCCSCFGLGSSEPTTLENDDMESGHQTWNGE